MKKHINIILANAPINNGNKGCVALTFASMILTANLLEKQGVTYTFYLSNSYYNDEKKHSVSINGGKIVFQDFISLPISIKDFIKHLSKIKSWIRSFVILWKCDFILDIGQGDSFADIYGKGRFWSIEQIHLLARLFHKPYCLLPQTIGPFSNHTIRKKAAKSLKKSSLVIARDRQSFDFAKKLVPNSPNIVENIDVAFFLPYQKKQFDKAKIHVGLNISGLLWNGGYSKQNQFGLKDDYSLLVKKIIEMFLEQKNVVVHLIPHVVFGYHHIENDYEVSHDLCKEYNDERLVLAPFFMDPCDAKGYISGLDFFMGARMHSTIAAFSSGVPVVPMAYSRKFNGLFMDSLNYHWIVDLKELECNDILARIRIAFEKRQELKEIIANRVENLEKNKFALEECLKKFFSLA